MSLRRAVERMLASQEEIEADDERLEALKRGTRPAGEVHARREATLSGVIRSVTYRPLESAPALVAELYDGSGSVDLVFLGRRRVPGVDTGRRMYATGMVTQPLPGRSRPVIYNPNYRLLPSGAEK